MIYLHFKWGGGYSKSEVDTLLDGKANSSHTHTKSQITDFPNLSTVATSGSYNDLSNKPTIPTVNNATLTIQKNGTTVDSFTANSSSDKTVNITVPTKTSDLTNDSNFITEDTTKIPLAGTNALSGNIIPSTDNSYNFGDSSHNFKKVYVKEIRHGLSSGSLVLSGGDGASSGAYLVLYGANRTDGFQGNFLLTANDGTNSYVLKGHQSGMLSWSGTVIRPYGDGSTTLGTGTYRFGQIYSTSSTISTSDQRKKQQIKSVDDKLLNAWENVNIVQFKFNDSVEEKGANARLHTGYIAQNIQQACEEKGVNPDDYGLFCFDSWEEQEEKKDKNGEVIEPYRAKGDLYSLRYEEALVVECAYLRREINKLKEELQQLKTK